MVENFAIRLNQADLVNKANFDNKITRFHKQITSNKTKHFIVQVHGDLVMPLLEMV